MGFTSTSILNTYFPLTCSKYKHQKCEFRYSGPIIGDYRATCLQVHVFYRPLHNNVARLLDLLCFLVDICIYQNIRPPTPRTQMLIKQPTHPPVDLCISVLSSYRKYKSWRGGGVLIPTGVLLLCKTSTKSLSLLFLHSYLSMTSPEFDFVKSSVPSSIKYVIRASSCNYYGIVASIGS
jgi:hypothetical protein